MPMGRLTPQRGTWQASGEATPSATLPEKFVMTPPPDSPLCSNVIPASEPAGDIRRAPIVSRRERMNGMRYLYARGISRMPTHQATGDGGINVQVTNFNRNDMSPIHNAGFNDALYQAGYPGFNLGLSFRVPTLQKSVQGPGANMFMRRAALFNNNKVNEMKRPSGEPKERK